MKIGVLTLPLNINYGGILQAYAMLTVLKKLGHKPYLIVDKSNKGFIQSFIYKLAFYLNTYIKRNNKFFMQKFIVKYISTIALDFDKINKINGVNTIIVGSDQVWRTIYAKPIEKYFLDFLENNSEIKKIAYAASFGVDNWDYTPQQTTNCARLAKQFDSISVREDSGIDLCRKYLGVTAVQVLDPTMLLDKEDYLQIVETEQIPKSKGNLFTYILDENNQKQDYIQKVASKLGLTPFSVLPTDAEINDGKKFLGIPVWLRAFEDAEFVVTDSFHGCVFSIIFNKPFIAIKNKDRGLDRFLSLFRLFNLEDRLIDLQEPSLDCLQYNIDWNKVNITRETMKKKSMAFLSKSLQK